MDGNNLDNNPASTTVKHRPVDLEANAKFAAEVKTIGPGEH